MTLDSHYPTGHDSTNETDEADSRSLARRRVRVATCFGIIAPGVDYTVWIVWAMQSLNGAALDLGHDPELFADILRTFYWLLFTRALGVVAAFLAGWWLAYPIYRAVCWVVRCCFFRHVSASSLQIASDHALWPLPYAAASGVIVWIVYWYVFPYGWTNDIICGSIGHLLGAWCYLTVIFSWVKVARSEPEDDKG